MYSFFNLTLDEGAWSRSSSSHFTSGKDPVPIVWAAGWASGTVRTDEVSTPTGIRSPDRPARSQSLYRLSYSGHLSILHGGTLKIATKFGTFHTGRLNFLHKRRSEVTPITCIPFTTQQRASSITHEENPRSIIQSV